MFDIKKLTKLLKLYVDKQNPKESLRFARIDYNNHTIVATDTRVLLTLKFDRDDFISIIKDIPRMRNNNNQYVYSKDEETFLSMDGFIISSDIVGSYPEVSRVIDIENISDKFKKDNSSNSLYEFLQDNQIQVDFLNNKKNNQLQAFMDGSFYYSINAKHSNPFLIETYLKIDGFKAKAFLVVMPYVFTK